jgi:hypothetical protein
MVVAIKTEFLLNTTSVPTPQSEIFHTTVTERQSFKNCRRQWYLDVVELLEPDGGVAWALIFGTVVHEALDAYYRSQRDLKRCLASFKKAWKAEDDRLAREFGGLYSAGIEQEWWEYHAKGLQMLKYYDQHDKQSNFFDNVVDVGLGFDAWRQNVTVEERQFIEVLDHLGASMSSLLSGRIDLVVKRKDGLWIVDHKTAASAPAWRALEVDDQLTGYCWIYWRMTGNLPRGALYNVLLKDPPKPPRLISDGLKISQDKAQRTTYDLYMEAIKENGFDIADYEDFLNFLSKKGWHTFFPRDGMQRNRQELESFDRALPYEVADMKAALADPNLRYKNASQRTCGMCSFVPLCQAMDDGSDVEAIKSSMYRVKEPRHSVPKKISDKVKKEARGQKA